MKKLKIIIVFMSILIIFSFQANSKYAEKNLDLNKNELVHDTLISTLSSYISDALTGYYGEITSW